MAVLIPGGNGRLGDKTMSIPKSHYFEARPAVPSRPHLVRLKTGGIDLQLQADRGVFGFRGVDLGTLMLLKEAPPPPGQGVLLDLGSGYGPIAIALARRSPQAKVWAVEVNERALELTRVNAVTAGSTNIETSLPEQVPDDLRFDAIYSNPPVRVGKQPLHQLLMQWLPRLKAGAAAYLVVQRNLGADSLQKWLNEQGFQAARLKSKKGYRILEVKAGHP
ncbi:MAG TPA: methyltransferase [Candidatus Dormibacteraeota bacterium]|nr:methyltransferase [Candidatus Dormibacteraeota bacterium]